MSDLVADEQYLPEMLFGQLLYCFDKLTYLKVPAPDLGKFIAKQVVKDRDMRTHQIRSLKYYIKLEGFEIFDQVELKTDASIMRS